MNKNLDAIFLYPLTWVDDEARMFADTAREWANKEIISDRLNYQKNYQKLFIEKRRILSVDIGFQRLVLPEDNGGFGWNTPSSAPGIMNVFSEIGRADAATGYVTALKYAIFATIAMEHNMNKKLCDILAPQYLADEIKTLSLILPGAGRAGEETPLFKGRAIRARIEEKEDAFILDGEALRPMGCGADADLFCIACADSDNRPCLAFVPAETKGVIKGDPIRQTGLDACKNADITLKKVKIPKENCIKRDGAIMELYAWLNLLLGGVSIGAAMNFHEILDEWAQSRVIKGAEPMKENPLCAFVLAEVADDIATARLINFSLSHIMAQPDKWGKVGGKGIYTFAQMIGARVQRLSLNALNRGMELMGSAGYAKEWHVEKHWRDIKTIQSHLAGLASNAPVMMDVSNFFYNSPEVQK